MVGKDDWIFDEKTNSTSEKDTKEDRQFIVSESELNALLRAEWLVSMIGAQAYYRLYKKLWIESTAPYSYAEERLNDFLQYNPKLP